MNRQIWFKGDCHGNLDITGIKTRFWRKQKKLNKDDLLFQLGDWGVLWRNKPDKQEKYLLKYWTEKKFTTLVVPGNHENYYRINNLPIVEKFGGKMRKVNDSIFLCERGEVYIINDKKFFTFGGADSIDKQHRVEGISWWREELPTTAEHMYGLDNLAKHNNKVDYVLTHTCPTDIIPMVGMPGFEPKIKDPTAGFLQYVASIIEFESWHFGHFHNDKSMGKFNNHYNKTVQLM